MWFKNFTFEKKYKMFKNKIIRNILILVIVIANIGCDQVSKKIARENIDRGDRIEVLSDKLILMNVENDGAFLSTGSNLPPIAKKILLLGLPVLMLVGAFIYLLINSNLPKLGLIGWSFVIGGGIGNLYDRIKFGSVTDFLFIDLGGVFRTGVFNMADVSIMVGMGFLILYYIQDSRKAAAVE